MYISIIFVVIHLPRRLTKSSDSDIFMSQVAPPARRLAKSKSRRPGTAPGCSPAAASSFLKRARKVDPDFGHSILPKGEDDEVDKLGLVDFLATGSSESRLRFLPGLTAGPA